MTGGALFGIGMGLPYVTGAALLLLIVLLFGSKIKVNAHPPLVQE